MQFSQPKIAKIDDYISGKNDSLWESTLLEICKDKEVMKFCKNLLNKQLDIDEVLDNVENKIDSKLPNDVRYLAKYAFIERQKEIRNLLIFKNRIENSKRFNKVDIISYQTDLIKLVLVK